MRMDTENHHNNLNDAPWYIRLAAHYGAIGIISVVLCVWLNAVAMAYREDIKDVSKRTDLIVERNTQAMMSIARSVDRLRTKLVDVTPGVQNDDDNDDHDDHVNKNENH